MSACILVVEDSPLIRDVIATQIDEWGYRVVTAESAEDALRVFDAAGIDLVVTDLGLPGMSGLELVGELRRRMAKIPVIVLSSEKDTNTVLEVVHRGVSDFVGKSEHASLLHAAITRTLDRVRLAEENQGLVEKLREMNFELEARVLERTRALEETNRKLIIEADERRRVEAELHLAHKLESVGRLAAGVAHEINTPIQFISNSTQFVKDSVRELLDLLERHRQAARRSNDPLRDELARIENDIDLPYLVEEVPEALDTALDGLGRVANIVRSMREFAHPDLKQKVAFDVNHAIESSLVMARNEYKSLAEVETDFATFPPFVGFPGEFNQVILNLVINAAHAIGDVVAKSGDKGRIAILTRRDGDHIVIRVSDTGGGIPPEIRARIFDPFFTTKEVGKGTGQGLAIARSVVVDRHGGDLTFQTEVGKGTTFMIRLPIASG